MQRSILSELDKNRLLEGPHAAQTQICDLHKQLMLKEVSPEGNVLRVRTNPLCMCINTKAHAEQDLLREMRDELNDALNEVAYIDSRQSAIRHNAQSEVASKASGIGGFVGQDNGEGTRHRTRRARQNSGEQRKVPEGCGRPTSEV